MSKINKIVELQVEVDDQEFEDVGIEIMSLVEEPAIGVHWAVFAAQQFVDKIAGESEDDYLGRCIPQLISEGYDQEQAAAICYSSFEEVANNDKEMVDGIIELLNKVEDLDNRLRMAQDVVKAFEEDGVTFDLVDFMNRVGFHNFEINVDGLPQYVDETGMTPEEIKKKIQEQILEMASRSNFGEVLDVEKTTFVNLSKTNFQTIGDYLRAVDALDVLDKIAQSGAQQLPDPSYRYTGPLQSNRSEERRVGKECRSRWSPYH